MKKIRRGQLLLSALRDRGKIHEGAFRGIRFSCEDLSNYDFSSLDLTRAKYQSCDLSKCNFEESNLHQGAFRNSNLAEANFTKACCPGVDFTKSVLRRARFYQTNLRDVIFSGTDLKSADFQEASFEGSDLRRSDFSECLAVGADFRKASLDEARFDEADLRASNFEGASLYGLKAEGAVFCGSTLRKANLEAAVLNGADFSYSDLTGADLKFSCLKNICFEGAKLSRADFRFSRGLTLAEKRALKRQGARVSFGSDYLLRTSWGKGICFLLGLGAALGIYLYFSDLQRQSFSTLRNKLTAAIEQKQYQRAIQIDLALAQKFETRENMDAMVSWTLNAANIYKILGQRPQALELMTGLLKRVGDDVQVSKVKLDLAIFYKEEGLLDKTLAFLKDVQASALENNFESSLKLARFLRELKYYPEAAAIYQKMIEKFGQDPRLRSEAAADLSQLTQEMGAQGQKGKGRGPDAATGVKDKRQPGNK